MLLPPDWTSRAGQWLRDPGPDSDVVFSTRVRLARNVDGYAFPGRISPEGRGSLEQRLQEWIAAARLEDSVKYWNLQGMSSLDKQVLIERHLISRELANSSGDRGVSFSDTELTSLMTNEEDHIRIQVIRGGLDLQGAYAAADGIDQVLGAHVPYAYSESYGYLTACPTNLGTGLRISVMVHLPALVLTNQMEKIFQAAAKVGLTVRGNYGEGSKASGDVIQISNQLTLGRSTSEIVGSMQNMVPKIVEYERGVRTHLINENRITLEDKVWRSMGMLRYARKLSSAEAMELLSSIRLGINLRLIPGITLPEINELFVITQPGHLQAIKGAELSENDRDVARADFLRRRMQAESN